MNRRLQNVSAIAVLATLVLAANAGAQTVLWDESVSGDISSVQAAPLSLLLVPGVNQIIGTVQGPVANDARDWITLTVPSGHVLSQVVLGSYTSTDPQGFMGLQFGSVFVGDPLTAAPYAGYAHFGTAADNGSLPPDANLVGVDILPIMANPAAAPGASGFAPPLGPGDYAFLIMQTGPTLTGYRFDFSVTPVPEPGSLLLSALGGLAWATRLWRRKKPAVSLHAN